MASYDVVIKGGTIIDGTGKERFQGDVGIKDGYIAAVGKLEGSGAETIDADGAIVTPGFTDIHTHYDGQVSWDEEMAPSSQHGVTTAVMGNCGVGFAPVKPQDRDRLIRLMEGVEDIPGSALAEGLTWDWESFPEYMQALDSKPHTIDFCAQLTHDALRVYVMGDRAIAEEAATDDDIRAMQALIREGLNAGAVGFSTGRSDNHLSADGLPTPASEAKMKEMIGLGKAFKGIKHGVIQAVSDFDMAAGPQHFDREFDLIEAMAVAADGHPLSISLMQRDPEPDQWKRIISRAEAANDKGIPMRLQVAPRAIGIMLGLEATFHPFMGFPSYKKICSLSLEERVRQMSKPEFKAQLLREKNEKVAGDGSSIPPMADELLANIDMLAMRLFELGERPNYEQSIMQSLGAKARGTQTPTLEVVYDALLKEGGKALLYFPLYNYITNNLDNLHTMLSHPLALPGLSDGGAHVGTVCDASFPTFLLTHWGRDRKEGRFPLEKLIKMQSHDTSAFIGLKDRGTLAVGMRADINVIDFDNLRLLPPRMHADLPSNGQRLLQNAEGYLATLVKGQVINRNGVLTSARPGRLAKVKA